MVLVRRAGYEVRGGVSLLRKLEGREGAGGIGEYFASHPPVAERCARLERQVREEIG
jgi:predicted Zn-dependent protease